MDSEKCKFCGKFFKHLQSHKLFECVSKECTNFSKRCIGVSKKFSKVAQLPYRLQENAKGTEENFKLNGSIYKLQSNVECSKNYQSGANKNIPLIPQNDHFLRSTNRNENTLERKLREKYQNVSKKSNHNIGNYSTYMCNDSQNSIFPNTFSKNKAIVNTSKVSNQIMADKNKNISFSYNSQITPNRKYETLIEYQNKDASSFAVISDDIDKRIQQHLQQRKLNHCSLMMEKSIERNSECVKPNSYQNTDASCFSGKSNENEEKIQHQLQQSESNHCSRMISYQNTDASTFAIISEDIDKRIQKQLQQPASNHDSQKMNNSVVRKNECEVPNSYKITDASSFAVTSNDRDKRIQKQLQQPKLNHNYRIMKRSVERKSECKIPNNYRNTDASSFAIISEDIDKRIQQRLQQSALNRNSLIINNSIGWKSECEIPNNYKSTDASSFIAISDDTNKRIQQPELNHCSRIMEKSIGRNSECEILKNHQNTDPFGFPSVSDENDPKNLLHLQQSETNHCNQMMERSVKRKNERKIPNNHQNTDASSFAVISDDIDKRIQQQLQQSKLNHFSRIMDVYVGKNSGLEIPKNYQITDVSTFAIISEDIDKRIQQQLQQSASNYNSLIMNNAVGKKSEYEVPNSYKSTDDSSFAVISEDIEKGIQQHLQQPELKSVERNSEREVPNRYQNTDAYNFSGKFDEKDENIQHQLQQSESKYCSRMMEISVGRKRGCEIPSSYENTHASNFASLSDDIDKRIQQQLQRSTLNNCSVIRNSVDSNNEYEIENSYQNTDTSTFAIISEDIDKRIQQQLQQSASNHKSLIINNSIGWKSECEVLNNYKSTDASSFIAIPDDTNKGISNNYSILN
ncbi:hypothetical protein NPIL_116791 [Nephila pilipes]|uniref:Uncharacterized protein n=1 Tax=Nephila pilipes TaxID=299642 RepID=A0A8X6JD98_NEPPI|nr:hypothetical protein NPIL_116791 [Nephila pilipes]